MFLIVTLIALLISNAKCSGGDCGKLNRGYTIDGMCYKLFLEKATFCEAQTHCENGGGNLLSKNIAAAGITEPFFRQFVKKHKTTIVHTGRQFWIGVAADGPNSTEYRTVRDEEATFASNITFSQYGALVVSYDRSDKFEPIYTRHNKDRTKSFICEYEL